MLKELIIWTLVIGIVYRLLTRFILPIFRVTSAATSHVRQMQDQMRKMEQQMNGNNTPNQPPITVTRGNKSANDGDYIEYEEVR